MICKKCKCTYIIKYGRRASAQCYFCKACGCQFISDINTIENEKRVAITLCCYGLSMRKVGDLLSYSHVTILNWIKQLEKRGTLPSEDYLMSIDEISEYLKGRANNPKIGSRRFANINAALTWSVENEISKVIDKLFSSLDDN